MDPEKHIATITIRGLVVAREWDVDGRATRAAIAAPGEEEYEVEPIGAGLELLEHLRREVEASGDLTTTANGHRLLALSSLRVISDLTGSEDPTSPPTGEWP